LIDLPHLHRHAVRCTTPAPPLRLHLFTPFAALLYFSPPAAHHLNDRSAAPLYAAARCRGSAFLAHARCCVPLLNIAATSACCCA